MSSKPPERGAIGYMIPERRIEVGWRRETSRITLSDHFLATVVGLSTLGTFFYACPTYRVLAPLIKRMLLLLSAYFIVAACYKRMHLTTSFYGMQLLEYRNFQLPGY